MFCFYLFIVLSFSLSLSFIFYLLLFFKLYVYLFLIIVVLQVRVVFLDEGGLHSYTLVEFILMMQGRLVVSVSSMMGHVINQTHASQKLI